MQINIIHSYNEILFFHNNNKWNKPQASLVSSLSLFFDGFGRKANITGNLILPRCIWQAKCHITFDKQLLYYHGIVYIILEISNIYFL